MQEQNIKDLLARRDKVNNEIEFATRKNEENKKKRAEIIEELKVLGLDVKPTDNLDTLIAEHTEKLNNDILSLEKEIAAAEATLNDAI